MARRRGGPAVELDGSARPPLGLAPSEFLQRYWQKHPVLVRQAFPGLVAPLSPEDLAGLACEPYALARLVEHDRRQDRWTVRSGPFAEEVFPALPGRDWTVLVQDVDKWDADVRALLEPFRFLPAWRIDDVMASFAAPGGSVGAHVDHYDVFLLQVHGHRRWSISTDPDAPLAFRTDAELKLLERFEPTHEWLLGPGDMLYLPPGVPHHGVAEDACLTLSVGMRAPSVAELITGFADDIAESLPEALRYADPDLGAAGDAFEIDAAALARVAAALAPLGPVDPARVGTWFGRFITRYRSAGEIVPPARVASMPQLSERLARGARLQRHPLARSAWLRQGRHGWLFVNGEAYATTPALAARLAAAESLDGAAFQSLPASGQALVHDLLQSGALALSAAPRRRTDAGSKAP